MKCPSDRRYSASVARAENLLDESPSYGRFVNDTYSDGHRTADFSDSLASPVPSEGTMSRGVPEEDDEAQPGPNAPGGQAAGGSPNGRAPLAPPPRRVKTSEDARLGATLARSCGCGTAGFRGYSSIFTYIVGGGWVWEALGSGSDNNAGTAKTNVRIRRSMSSRIAVEALQDNEDEED